eukprot:6081085-Lingulodinium_polyedra.AAC.1
MSHGRQPCGRGTCGGATGSAGRGTWDYQPAGHGVPGRSPARGNHRARRANRAPHARPRRPRLH